MRIMETTLAAFVTAVETFDVPAWVRIGYEFEGDWNGYTPEGYVAAYQWEDDRLQIDELVRQLYVEELSHPAWTHAPESHRIGYHPAQKGN